MGASPSELPFLRAGTQRFIDLDPTTIVLTPRNDVWLAGTKVRGQLPDRDPQVFKVIWTDFGAGFSPTIVGPETRRFDFVLVGAYDAEIAIGDFWKVGDQDNEVTHIYPSNGYEVKAGGVSHGGNPHG